MDSQNNVNLIRKKANRYFLIKMAVNIVLIIMGSLLITLFLSSIQKKDAIRRQHEESKAILSEVVSILDQNAEDAQELTRLFHAGNQHTAEDLMKLLNSSLYDSLVELSKEERCEVIRDMIERSGVSYLYVMDSEGKIVLSPYAQYTGTLLLDQKLMKEENLAKLVKGTADNQGNVDPVFESNAKGDYYFYSVPIITDDSYVLVIGADVSALELQLSSLKSIDVILKRAAGNNGSFLFAVDDEDHNFLFFENEENSLTGLNAEECGMSPDALQDGYTGVQIIAGIPYYCVTRTTGTQTIICAASSESAIYSANRYILFWSILGFVLVMLLCLSYAIIVRNDFVNKHTETEKVNLFKVKGTQIVYDRTLGKKIFPLMTAGVLLIFGISFYAQTLLEISDTVELSETAIQEVYNRYLEGEESRVSIIDYNNNSFLAKAKLLSFLLEEDPSFLNEGRDNPYTVYDENKIKHVLPDDEGNPLTAVKNSPVLQNLCEENDLHGIMVYDENGRTIATNNDNWYFVLSFDEEDQSYPFRDVVDGKIDNLIQEPGINDIGINAQYIGVAFNYYTMKGKDGETEYMSRYAYEKSLLPEYEGAKITRHRSMLQIGLQGEIVEKLLATTDVEYIFSTDTLRNGFVVLFDTGDDHRVLYSPNKNSIGKTAAEIGVSEKAFSGEYYGFQRVNGVDYFQYYTYADGGYYIATAIPRTEMYSSRWKLSLITSLVSLLLIMILSLTVSLTTPDEEILFIAVSDEFKDMTGATMFNIIMPSGRTKTTTKAVSRWDNGKVLWKDKAPEQKLVTLFEGAMAVILFYLLLTVLGARFIFTPNSVIRYILAGGWDRGVNIFAVSACCLVMVMVYVLINLFKIPVRLASTILGARTETIGRLLLSVLKYGSVLAGFFYCLYLLGLDASSLIASAGILSLVIGLGAQSLIKDVIAGIFIVFEGDFRVGDIVTINDFRGTVIDIGLRTAKIMNVEDNIKIFNNSEISGVLNMTKQESYASCLIGIAFGQDIAYVESVLERELPMIGEQYEKIISGPKYLGVKKISESSVDLLIIAKCQESNVGAVTRILNKETLQIFYRNNIGVPFPNVTISYLDPTDGKSALEETSILEEKQDDVLEENNVVVE